MTTLLILAILGQVRYADEFAGPSAVRPSAEFADPELFPARVLPAELRPAVAPLPPLPDQVFAPAPLPDLPTEVFAPAPRRRIIRVVGPPDAPPANPSPTPGIRRPEAEEALLQRLADVEARVDALERGAKAAAVPPVVPPQATPPRAAVKQWRVLVGEPGVEGFGALNARGEIVVEQRRYMTPPVATYATYQEPIIYQQPAPIYGTSYGTSYGPGFGACSVSGPGGCGVGGLFGGRFR